MQEKLEKSFDIEDTFIFALDNLFSILREEYGAFTFVEASLIWYLL